MRDAAELTGIASALLEALFPVENGIRLLSLKLSSLDRRARSGSASACRGYRTEGTGR